MHELPKLPYGFDTLEPIIDKETMEVHYEKHHQGYVDKLNKALEGHDDFVGKSVVELLKDLDSLPEGIKATVRNNGGGHANHSLFWQIMVPEGQGGKPSEKLMEGISKAFGSGDLCHEKFVEAAKGHFGSGWCWLVVNEKKELEILTTANQDSPVSLGKIPILGLDVWEHAYYLKYQNRRPEYVEKWTKLINWKKVNELYDNAMNE
jgi:superoxide dismutase, Fe-Mn family